MTTERKAAFPQALATLMHEDRCSWLAYVLALAPRDDYAQLVIPAEAVRRWERQKDSPFAELPDAEKEVHRVRAEQVLDLLANALAREYADVLTWEAGMVRNAAAGVLLRLSERVGVTDVRARAESLDE